MKPKPRSPKRKRSRLECVAYHEAGHFVASMFSHHLPATRLVTIVPNPKAHSLGHHLPFPERSFQPEEKPDLNRIFDRIVVLYAGTIAEERFSGRANRVGARSDSNQALDLALFVSSGESARWMLRWVRSAAENLVNVRWWAVEAVAKALLERKTMTGKEARQIVIAVMNAQIKEQQECGA